MDVRKKRDKSVPIILFHSTQGHGTERAAEEVRMGHGHGRGTGTGTAGCPRRFRPFENVVCADLEQSPLTEFVELARSGFLAKGEG